MIPHLAKSRDKVFILPHDKFNQTHNLTITLKLDSYINFVPKNHNYKTKLDEL